MLFTLGGRMNEVIKDWLFCLRENNFEKFEHYKNFLEFIEVGYEISKTVIDDQQDIIRYLKGVNSYQSEKLDSIIDENGKLHEANERLLVELSKALGIYHE